MDDKTIFEKRLEVVAKICTILIPIILFYFGNELQKIKDAQNIEQQNFNRITTLLKSLSSENALEKKLAIKFSESLATKGNFPSELLAVMNEVAVNDSANSKAAQAVINAVNKEAAGHKNSNLQSEIKAVVSKSPSKIYTQIPADYNLLTAKDMLSKLSRKGYNMLGIERVNRSKSPLNNEIRYFKNTDKSFADSLAVQINAILKKEVTVKYITGYEQKIVGSQLEVWLMK